MILNKKPDSPLLTLLTQKQKKPPVASQSLSPAPAVKSRSSSTKKRSKSNSEQNVKQITSYFQVLSSPPAQSSSSKAPKSTDEFVPMHFSSDSECEPDDKLIEGASIHSDSSNASIFSDAASDSVSAIATDCNDRSRRKK
jgi:hypothetical protein